MSYLCVGKWVRVARVAWMGDCRVLVGWGDVDNETDVEAQRKLGPPFMGRALLEESRSTSDVRSLRRGTEKADDDGRIRGRARAEKEKQGTGCEGSVRSERRIGVGAFAEVR